MTRNPKRKSAETTKICYETSMPSRERLPSTNSDSSVEPMEISGMTNKTGASDMTTTSSTSVVKIEDRSDQSENESSNNEDDNRNHRYGSSRLLHKKLINQNQNLNKTNNNNNNSYSNHNNNNNIGDYNNTITTAPTTTVERKCPICEETFTSEHSLTEHIRKHNSENMESFQCRICSKTLSSASSLDRHILVHSGERPFTCKYCHLTFTTNGNMHRHMRNHKKQNMLQASTVTEESDDGRRSNESAVISSNDGDENEIENSFNNNKRKMADFDEEHNEHESKRKIKTINNNTIETTTQTVQKFCCPVCERNDFVSMVSLENHLDNEHPSHQARCKTCDTLFSSHKMLNGHRCVAKLQQNHVTHGFKDLTFVDFSSDKFPIIAKSVCERSIRTSITSQNYECGRCFRAFPCAASLDIHTKDCDYSETTPQDFSLRNKRPRSRGGDSFGELEHHQSYNRRDDFFANLDLLNKSISMRSEFSSPSSNVSSDAITPNHRRRRTSSLDRHHDTKDLADIQSILNVTSSSGGLLRQLDRSTKDQSCHSHSSKGDQEEEVQDAFTAEFRKMKLRGEFPCKLCTAIFPNLRALKGHNRIHVSAAGPGPYLCNMCPYQINDKAALIRHMRTHNGDRPYECAVCNYAFTTKANCERHLRNRHAKTTRDEVKRAIIYHPSEDSTTDELHHSKKATHFGSFEYMDDEMDQIPKDRSTPVSHLKEQLLRTEKHSPIVNKIQVKSLEKLINHQGSTMDETFDEEDDDDDDEDDQNEESFENGDTDEGKPIDLSMDALDLSKKTSIEENKVPMGLDLSLLERNQQFLMAQQEILNQAFPKIDPAHYFQLSNLYRNIMFPTGFPIHPFLLHNQMMAAPPPSNNITGDLKDLMMKDSMRNQMSGGSMIEHSPVPTPMNQIREPSPTPPPPPPVMKPEKIMTTPQRPPLPNLPINHSTQASNGSVKMVIKNGVLMPKQKQRRYRTERPFACEHCSARFTLRSNMERHVKQQHPQFWAARQRSGHSLLKRGPVPHQPQPSSSPQMKTPSLSQPFQNLNNFTSILEQQYKFKQEPVKPPIIYDPIRFNCNQLNNSAIPQLPTTPVQQQDEEDEPQLVIDEDSQPEDLTKSEAKSIKPEPNVLEAKKIAETILEQARKASTNNTPPVKTPDESSPLALMMQNQHSPDIPLNLIPKPEVSKYFFKDGGRDSEADLVSVSKLVDNANLMSIGNYFRNSELAAMEQSDEEGLVASGSASESNTSGAEDVSAPTPADQPKKKSAYSLAPNRVACPYCQRMFPWTSSLRRHILTHTGQKPFKCSHCPLLFTTKSNCDRHLLRKHTNVESAMSVPMPIEDLPDPTPVPVEKEPPIIVEEKPKITPQQLQQQQSSTPPQPIKSETPTNSFQFSSELPFKCHLCDGSFSDRQFCLDHIKITHPQDFALLMAKGAIDAESETQASHAGHLGDDEKMEDGKGGKYPDYANRKVICAFCVRRFWSTEDLRRHMRTHSGERPFQCEICLRKFTLKHSMLRHQKKHSINNNNQQQTNSASDMSDEETMIVPSTNATNKLLNLPNLIPKALAQFKLNLLRNSLAAAAHHNKEEAGSSEHNNHRGDRDSPPPSFRHFQQHLLAAQQQHMQQQNDEERVQSLLDLQRHDNSDLIGNLLGISDQGILNRVLFSSPDEAAKLLGVDK